MRTPSDTRGRAVATAIAAAELQGPTLHYRLCSAAGIGDTAALRLECEAPDASSIAYVTNATLLDRARATPAAAQAWASLDPARELLCLVELRLLQPGGVTLCDPLPLPKLRLEPRRGLSTGRPAPEAPATDEALPEPPALASSSGNTDGAVVPRVHNAWAGLMPSGPVAAAVAPEHHDPRPALPQPAPEAPRNDHMAVGHLPGPPQAFAQYLDAQRSGRPPQAPPEAPAGNPRASPPISTPPASTPPISTPPVSTPPARLPPSPAASSNAPTPAARGSAPARIEPSLGHESHSTPRAVPAATVKEAAPASVKEAAPSTAPSVAPSGAAAKRLAAMRRQRSAGTAAADDPQAVLTQNDKAAVLRHAAAVVGAVPAPAEPRPAAAPAPPSDPSEPWYATEHAAIMAELAAARTAAAGYPTPPPHVVADVESAVQRLVRFVATVQRQAEDLEVRAGEAGNIVVPHADVGMQLAAVRAVAGTMASRVTEVERQVAPLLDAAARAAL